MDIEAAKKHGIDWDNGIGRFMGKTAMYEKYLGKFLKDESYQELVQALDANDTAAAFKAAHTFKGVAGNLSFQTLFDKTYPMVELLREGKLEEAKVLLPEVSEEYKSLRSFLEEQLNQVG